MWYAAAGLLTATFAAIASALRLWTLPDIAWGSFDWIGLSMTTGLVAAVTFAVAHVVHRSVQEN